VNDCPHCSKLAPDCPVCGTRMLNNDCVMPPKMNGRSRIICHKWTCSQSDGKGETHYVELQYPHKGE